MIKKILKFIFLLVVLNLLVEPIFKKDTQIFVYLFLNTFLIFNILLTIDGSSWKEFMKGDYC